MADCFICTTRQSIKLRNRSAFKTRMSCENRVSQILFAKARLNADKNNQLSYIKNKFKSVSNVSVTNALMSMNLRPKIKIVGNIKNSSNFSLSSKSVVKGNNKFVNLYTDKLAGHLEGISSIKDFACIQKLYPISDSIISHNNSIFINQDRSTTNLFDSIDEGLFTGNYNKNLNKSIRISDDDESYIQPSSIFTSGIFRYKCEVTRPYHHPENSFLFIRASAPTSNYASDIPPEYRIHNIKLEDPSGNIIVKYKDFNIRGDADYSLGNIKNYSTYVSEPEINNALLRTWDENYPVLNEESGYTLNIDFEIMCLDDPFDQGFSKGYEENTCELKFLQVSGEDYLALDGTPLSTHTQGYHLNPTNSIRISAIEICNSGDFCSLCEVSGIKLEDRINLITEIPTKGNRLSKTIYPVELELYESSLGIYPEQYSLWKSSPDFEDNVYYNSTLDGAYVLLQNIKNPSIYSSIQLEYNKITDIDGRLSLKFSHQKPNNKAVLRNGAFENFLSNRFNVADKVGIAPVDEFFVVDEIELKVVAKKAEGTDDYVIDVVGYSDDKLINVTPKVGAFLQNKNIGEGSVPVASGFDVIDDLGISSESISDKSAYYERGLTSIDAGDHYKLSSLPVINSTEFVEYTIPLAIYEDYVDLGKSIDYSMSSYFENLYVDLYSIPSGASIANVALVIKYKPSNALMLNTMGMPTQSEKDLDRANITLLPTNSSGAIINSNIVNQPLSAIYNIPHAYREDVTLKTNYARRWRGVDGNIVTGPFNVNEFDYGFLNNPANYPFLNGYFDLNNSSGNWIISEDYSMSGYYLGSNPIMKNIGWRFNSDQLFSKATDYKTLDWIEEETSDNLYGKICDAFDSAIKITSTDGLELQTINLKDGFAIFLRFTPGENFDGTQYSTLLTSDNDAVTIYITGKKISAYVKNSNGNTVSAIDSIDYDEYQYPLSILLTFYDNSLRLYCNDELRNSPLLRRVVPSTYSLLDTNSNLKIISDNQNEFFLHELGVSATGNIVDSNPDRFLKQTTAENFLYGHSHAFSPESIEKFRLHSYVNSKNSDWYLGDFKSCYFSSDFDGFFKRIGNDYIVHTLKYSGSGYKQVTDLELPPNMNLEHVAYHTQIENDFLRLNLQDIPNVNNGFYSVTPRISKNIPRGYNFAERALVVDSIIEHETLDNISWPDGSIGPKLIVSLYSKNKDPLHRPSKVNWGLINRAIHYLPPSGCYEKISSTFNHNDLLDISEPWALFDLENIKSEFDQKYFSQDINDMFLQYDIVYPSGGAFNSRIKIHNVNIKIDDALTYWREETDKDFVLFVSGEPIINDDIDLFIHGSSGIYDQFNLYVENTPMGEPFEALPIYVGSVSGIPKDNLNLYTRNRSVVSSASNFSTFFGSDNSNDIIGMNLYVSGQKTVGDDLNLFVFNKDQTNEFIPLFTSGVGISESSVELPMFLETFDYTFDPNYSPFYSSSLNLYSHSDQKIIYYDSGTLPLYTNTDVFYANDSFNLYVLNYLEYNQQEGQQSFVSWTKNNVGSSIDAILDEDAPSIPANDPIRGVDSLICYGECEDVNDSYCREESIIIHDIEFYKDFDCIEGGILRPKFTYTNQTLEPSYSGDFYGIRKYDGLIPNSPYNITIKTRSGNNIPINLPSEFVELNYGSNEYVDYSGVKLTADKDLNPYTRSAGDKYGKSVAAKNDLIAVGAPMKTVSYSEYDDEGTLINYDLEKAGTVFVYRRKARPDGVSWPIDEHKSEWSLEVELTLPSGLLKDYPEKRLLTSINGQQIPVSVFENYWQVGQEGREFGHSVDLAINESSASFAEDKKEIIVVGAPKARWQRDFDDLEYENVSIGLLVFTDEFKPTIIKPSEIYGNAPPWGYMDVLQAIEGRDLLYSFFAKPPVRFNVKLIICEPKAKNTTTEIYDFSQPKPSFINKVVIPRYEGQKTEDQTLAIFSGIKSAFEQTFPYDTTSRNNGIPVMLGCYVDQSRSLGDNAVQPALDQFLSYYKEYSFASGLMDVSGTQSSGAVYEYRPDYGQDENWVTMSISLIDDLLDTGRLIEANETRFISEGIGPENFNGDLTQFNHPPSSGGKVYVFEKESGVWNLIQQIDSPAPTSYDSFDIFGHAVGISEDTNIIAVGSPYMSECCNIYQHIPEEKERLYSGLTSWLDYQNSVEGGSVSRYLMLKESGVAWFEEYGFDYANHILYSQLTSTEKFLARKYLEIEEYQKVFSYSHGSIPYNGTTWNWLAGHFAPTSRLGYSVAVNDDGNTVAFGAPTDSFNVYDDRGIYYEKANNGYQKQSSEDESLPSSPQSSWRSNVNSGAVRLFESRDYFPHNKVVEYGKFGNLQQALGDSLDEGHFDYLSRIFTNSGKEFIKMPEEDSVIPKDAGLAFIITPGVDALSEEVIENIISWLALGDRNLVLVGNDPIWEADGAYRISNNIINRILSRVESRMRLYPARNIEESLPSGYSVVVPSFKPDGGSTTYISASKMTTASGVADIRMYVPGMNMKLECDEDDPFNDSCAMPLTHEGDLRAQWNGACLGGNPSDPELVSYTINWPYLYGTNTPTQCLDYEAGKSAFNLPGHDPVPILVAAKTKTEWLVQRAVPPSYIDVPIYETLIKEGDQVTQFVENEIFTEPAFVWDIENQDFTNYESNINEVVDNTPWFTPSSFAGRSGILQSKAVGAINNVPSRKFITDTPTWCVEEIYKDQTTSKIICLASINTESQINVYNGAGDENANFYINLVSRTRTGGSIIHQLGSWTGRSSFRDAIDEFVLERDKSVLYDLFNNSGNDVFENVENPDSTCNIMWIANPLGLPNSNQLKSIQDWLKGGNKKLVITHDSTEEQISRVQILLTELGSDIEILYLPGDEEYPRVLNRFIAINQNHPVGQGLDDKYQIDYFSANAMNYVPFVEKPSLTQIAYTSLNRPITDLIYEDVPFLRLNTGVDKISFPVVEGSGYKLFFSYIQENYAENVKLDIYVDNCGISPGYPLPIDSTGFQGFIQENIEEDPYLIEDVGYYHQTSAVLNEIRTVSQNIQVKSSPYLNIYINALKTNILNTEYAPRTHRLVSISGVMVPLTTFTATIEEDVVVGYDKILVNEGTPETSGLLTFSDAIKSLNDKYCFSEDCFDYGWNGKPIEDGPMVVAQELESFTDFPAGVNRSRITLISDSNLVQGRYMADEFGRVPPPVYQFILSLYPETNFPSEVGGKQYVNQAKIVSPERGSPGKYYSLTKNPGANVNFGGKSASLLTNFSDKESLYDPRYVIRQEYEPWPKEADEDVIEQIKQEKYAEFIRDEINSFGGSTAFSGIIDGQLYADIPIDSGFVPKLLEEKGYDYLDFDHFVSGFPGDLFGYSISLHKNKLVVGSPFSAFSDPDVNDWSYYDESGSGIEISYNGGAGSVYIFEKDLSNLGDRTFSPWKFRQKLRPSNINPGQDIENSGDASAYNILGPHSYTDSYLRDYSYTTDQFGYSVSIDSDIIVVGAPGHDFGKNIDTIYERTLNNILYSGSFIRKAFNTEFDIPQRIVTDLGNSGVRNEIQSGDSVLNNGAIFAFENKFSDWSNRELKWEFVEKIVPQGINERIQNINDNDFFGRSVYVHRSKRSDSDYVIVGGSENHSYDKDGENNLEMAGSAYTHDIVLRELPVVYPNKDCYMDIKVFGYSLNDDYVLKTSVNNQEIDQEYQLNGLVYSDKRGAIFLEASGRDPSAKGFIQHRPFVVSINGGYRSGSPNDEQVYLFVEGSSEIDNSFNLYLDGFLPSSGYVYNNMGLYTSSIVDFSDNSLNFYTYCPAEQSASGLSLFLRTSGVVTDTITMAVRGY